MIKLYGLEISGNTYKAQLLMSLLGIQYDFIELDTQNLQHKSTEFLQLNPRGEFPVLQDEDRIIWDSQAILIYLASQYSLKDHHWFPCKPADMAAIAQWLSVANGEIFNTLGKARSVILFQRPGDLSLLRQQGEQLLKWINHHLKQRDWIATQQASIADIACYPYISLCEAGGISLDGYRHIHRWFKNIESLEKYISMPGLYA